MLDDFILDGIYIYIYINFKMKKLYIAIFSDILNNVDYTCFKV